LICTVDGTAPGLTIEYFARGAASTVDSATTFAGGADASDIVGRVGCDGAGTTAAVFGAAVVGGAARLSVGAGVARRDDGNIIGVTTMTSAISTSARRVRLSIRTEAVAREPDHSRRGGTDCTARSVAVRANCLVSRHVVRVLRSRTRSSLDNNGRMEGAAARASPDTREPPRREAFAY